MKQPEKSKNIPSLCDSIKCADCESCNQILGNLERLCVFCKTGASTATNTITCRLSRYEHFELERLDWKGCEDYKADMDVVAKRIILSLQQHKLFTHFTKQPLYWLSYHSSSLQPCILSKLLNKYN
jgi:hypothetical protein